MSVRMSPAQLRADRSTGRRKPLQSQDCREGRQDMQYRARMRVPLQTRPMARCWLMSTGQRDLDKFASMMVAPSATSQARRLEVILWSFLLLARKLAVGHFIVTKS